MIRHHAISLLLLLLPLLASAQIESQFKFTGQNAEVLKMDKLITVLRPVAKQVPGTCTRQIPEQQHICRDVTRYKKECRWVPADTNCWNEDEQVCRSVTRYRDDCHQGPSRQVCERDPDRQVCTDRPDRKVCRDLPDRNVCRNLPDTTVCTDRPDREVCSERTGTRVCSTIPGGRDCKTVDGGQECRMEDGGTDCQLEDGGQDCRTVSGGTSCHTVPGDNICRQVSYQDQECQNVPRQRCENIPAHNACEDVPYSVNVCGNETVYRTESYACMKTEMVNMPLQKLLSGTINVQINTNGLVEEFAVNVSASGKTADMKEMELGLKLPVDPKLLVIMKKKNIKISGESEKEIKFEGSVELEMVENKVGTVIFPTKISYAYIIEEDQNLEMVFKGVLPKSGEITLKMTGRNIDLPELKVKYPSERAEIAKIDRKEGLRIKMAGLLPQRLSKMKMDLKLAVPMTEVKGEILNNKKPESSKVFEKVRVDLY